MFSCVTSNFDGRLFILSIALGDVNITTYSSPHLEQVNLEIIPTGVLSELMERQSCESKTELISTGSRQSIEPKLLHKPFPRSLEE
jgi:hypothetical protein